MAKAEELRQIINEYDLMDTHAHINDEPLIEQEEFIVNLAEQNKVIINNAGAMIADSLTGINQAKKYRNVFAMIGYHPYYISYNPDCLTNPDEIVERLESMYLENRNYVLCIGEIGLEKINDEKLYNIQKETFIKLLALARKYNLAVNLHVRDAHEDAIKILKEHGQGLRLIAHCFALGTKEAKDYLDLGCFIAVNGIITFEKKNEDILNAIPHIPMDKILIETDCPFLTPVPFRGKQNMPSYVKYTFKKLASIYQVNEDDLKQQLKKNAISAFLGN